MFVERKSKHVRRLSGTHTHSHSRAGKDWQPHINEMKRIEEENKHGKRSVCGTTVRGKLFPRGLMALGCDSGVACCRLKPTVTDRVVTRPASNNLSVFMSQTEPSVWCSVHLVNDRQKALPVRNCLCVLHLLADTSLQRRRGCDVPHVPLGKAQRKHS